MLYVKEFFKIALDFIWNIIQFIIGIIENILDIFKLAIQIIKHIEPIGFNIIIIGIILFLNLVYLIIYRKEIRRKKHMPLAIHITQKLYIAKKYNEKIYKKLLNLHVCHDEEELICNYYYKKITIIILIILGVNIISTGVCLGNHTKENLSNNQYINRPEYGDPSKKVDLNIEIQDNMGKKKHTDVSVIVKPNRLSKKEEEHLIIKVKEYIRREALGDNESYGQIFNKLNLITTYNKDSNVTIAWTLDKYGIINSSGNIDYNNAYSYDLELGIDVMLIANIKYFDNEYQYPLYMTIYKSPKSKEELVRDRIKEEVSRLNSSYIESGEIKLPDKIENYKIKYSEKKDNSKKNNLLIIIIMGIITILSISYGMNKDIDNEMVKKDEVLMLYYREIVNKLQLLLSAGLNVTAAWEKICMDYLYTKKNNREENYAYEEMVYTYKSISMGMPHIEAYKAFGKRIGLSPYIKLSTLILQNIRTGSDNFIDALELESKVVELNQKELYLKKGEKLGVKLLIPMIIMMGITLLLVVIPAFIKM